MKRILTLFFLTALGVFSSCQKQDEIGEVIVKDFNNLQVPAVFPGKAQGTYILK